MGPGYEHRCAVWLGHVGHTNRGHHRAHNNPFDTFAPMPDSHLLIAAPACAPCSCCADKYIVLTCPGRGASWARSRSGTAALQWPLLCSATQADFCFAPPHPPRLPALASCPPCPDPDIFSFSEIIISTCGGWRWLRAAVSVREAGLQRWCSLLWPRVRFLKFGSCCPCCGQASSGLNALGRRTDAWCRRP